MDFSEALKAIDIAVFACDGRHLNDVEEDVLSGTWQGLTYPEMAKTSSYSLNYLKQDIGPSLWKLLSRALGQEIGKSNFRSTVEKKILEQLSSQESLENFHVHNQEVNTPYQKLNGMLLKLDKICFETATVTATGADTRKFNLANAYVEMMSRYFELFSRNISNISIGRINIRGQQRSELTIQLLAQLLEKFRCSSKEILSFEGKISLYAVSYGDIHRWWETALAEEFIYLNSELAKYINVERIFVLQQHEVEEMRPVMELHKAMNIEKTYFSITNESTTKFSFLVCEGLFTNESFIKENGDELEGGYISVTSRDIVRNLTRFNAIKKMYPVTLYESGMKFDELEAIDNVET
jgi:hypothetical protein